MKIAEILTEGFFKDLHITYKELQSADSARLFVNADRNLARLDVIYDDGSYDTLDLRCRDPQKFGKTVMAAAHRMNAGRVKNFTDALKMISGKTVGRTVIKLFLDWEPVGGKMVQPKTSYN